MQKKKCIKSDTPKIEYPKTVRLNNLNCMHYRSDLRSVDEIACDWRRVKEKDIRV